MAFLDRNDWISAHRAQFRDALDKSNQFGTYCVRCLSSLEVPHELRKEVVSSLFARALEHYNGTIRMSAAGWPAPAKVLVRALLETTFALVAVTKKDKVLRRYRQNDEYQRRELYRKLSKVKDPPPECQGIYDAAAHEALEAKLESERIGSLTTYQLAEAAGLENWYSFVYPMLSAAAHSRIRDLQSYMSIGESNQIESYTLDHASDDTAGLLGTAGFILGLSVESVVSVFGIDVDNRLTEFTQYFADLGGLPSCLTGN